MKFVLNCDSVSQLGTTINGYATELASTTSEISALNPKTSYFDFAGAIRTINANVNAAADKMSNTYKYIQAVVDKHTEIQATLRFDMPVIEIDSVIEPNGEVTGEDPTLVDGENKDEITEGTGTEEGVTDTVEDNNTVIESPNPDATDDGLTPVKTITVPEGYGTQLTRETKWELIGITNPEHQNSRQYRLRGMLGDEFQYDEEGFGKARGRYLVACTQTFGEVGDYIDFTLEDGTTFPCIIADSKGSANASRGVNDYGHKNGTQVLEFIVSQESYNQKGNPGEATNHPEWNHRVVSATNYGNKFF